MQKLKADATIVKPGWGVFCWHQPWYYLIFLFNAPAPYKGHNDHDADVKAHKEIYC